jgi:uncharacterized protein
VAQNSVRPVKRRRGQENKQARTPVLRGVALAAAGLGTAGLTAGLAYAYARTIGRRWLRVSTHDVTVASLPPAWEGVRVVHLTDVHLGARGTPHRMIERAIRTATAAQPDVIALTGDYVDDGRPRRRLDELAPLAEAAPTFAVLGNHDYARNGRAADQIAERLSGLGIHVLRNETAEVSLRGARGQIAGFDDALRGQGANLGTVLAQLQGERPVLCLIHEPDVIDEFPASWAGLTLAGHTHGAQVALSPIRQLEWIRWLRPSDSRKTRYPRGWFTVRGNLLYVNRGLGVSGRPLRFGVRPEVAIFTLYGAAGAPAPDERAAASA